MKPMLALLSLVLMAHVAVAQEEVIDATNIDLLRSKAGTDVVVEGSVTEIGKTKDGGITFINIGLPKKQGFVAVVFQAAYEAFPEGFDKYRAQKVRVKGALKLYKGETPQISLASPEQITVVTEE